MAVTQLDPKTALLVIDLQKGLMSFPTAHPIGNVVKLARQLLDAFRRHHLPVVLVNVAGGAPGRTESPPRTACSALPLIWPAAMPLTCQFMLRALAAVDVKNGKSVNRT